MSERTEAIDAEIRVLAAKCELRCNRLTRVLREVLSIPAVQQAVGRDHVGMCRCPICRAHEILGDSP